MMKKILPRLKNPKVLVAIVSGVSLILVNLGLIDLAMSEKAMEITNILLGILVAMGIVADPESHMKK